MSEITFEKCPCGNLNCRDFHLRGIGHFCQGSGFTRDEAVKIVQALSLVPELIAHLDYCGWGDSWERECSENLRNRAAEYKAAHPEDFANGGERR